MQKLVISKQNLCSRWQSPAYLLEIAQFSINFPAKVKMAVLGKMCRLSIPSHTDQLYKSLLSFWKPPQEPSAFNISSLPRAIIRKAEEGRGALPGEQLVRQRSGPP